jgi:hypothetical protein
VDPEAEVLVELAAVEAVDPSTEAVAEVAEA